MKNQKYIFILFYLMLIFIIFPNKIDAETISVKVTTNLGLSIRSAATTKSSKLGVLEKNTIVNVSNKIYGYGCSKWWYEIASGEYKGNYICSNYTTKTTTSQSTTTTTTNNNQNTTNTTTNNTITENSKTTINDSNIIHTIKTSNLRSQPTTNSKVISTIKTNKNLIIKETKITTNSGCSSEKWYKVTYENKTGYICSANVDSYATTDGYINTCDQSLTNNQVAIKRIDSDGTSKISIKKSANSNSENITSVSAGDKFNLISETNYYYKIDVNGTTGYISKNRALKISQNETFVDVDLSEHKLTLYINGKCSIKTSVVTGISDQGDGEVETRKGAYSIKDKVSNKYFKDSNVYSNYWMPFDNGIGLHDADNWRSSYGYKASHGCVNIPLTATKKIFENVSIGTKVIVHE